MAVARARPDVLLLAAGQGTRMRSKRIKLMHAVAGAPMVRRVADCAAAALRPKRLVAVVGFQADDVRAALEGACTEFVLQADQRGTGHAVLLGLARARGSARGTVVILNGDLPTLRPETLRALLRRHRRSGAALTVLSTMLDAPDGYGRIVRDGRGGFARIVEHRDATREERGIHEVNCGIYCAEASRLLPVLRRLRPNNAQGELYITDAVRRLVAAGEKVAAVRHDDAEEVLGVNTRAELARASRELWRRKAEALMASGVTLLDPERTWVDPAASVGRDTVLWPGVVIEGASTLGEDCVVRPGCRVVDSRIGDGSEIKDHCVVQSSDIGSRCEIGPFAHLRPGNALGSRVKVGNFVELKKALLGDGVKASHLSYLGDAEIGAGSNVGAGTITCNYDGRAKYRTTLGRGVFVGSDSQLVAPVTVGDGAYIGAGTTVTADVPAGALAVGRARQRNIEGWVERRAQRAAPAPASAGRGARRRA